MISESDSEDGVPSMVGKGWQRSEMHAMTGKPE